MALPTDADLLAAARTNASAFRAFYERYAERVYGYHLRRTREPEAAYDLTAETFAQAWFARGRFRDRVGGNAGPWLFAVARNVLVDSVRRRRLEMSACERLGVVVEASTEPDETWLDGLDEALDGALDDLPTGQGDAIRLRVVDELEYEDVARELGTTPAAARVRVHRGLSSLRHRLRQRQEAS
jgi:RNA polymerase sigma-70 factor (ECF subfamily)